MSITNIAGWVIVAVFFILGFVACSTVLGVKTALKIYIFTISLTAALAFAAYLIST